MDLVLYGNGGSGNHGCEAIIRGTIEIWMQPDLFFIINSNSPEEDIKYGVEEIAKVTNAKSTKISFIDYLIAYVKLKFRGDFATMDGIPYLNQIRKFSKNKKVLALSVGGDNYCYTGQEFYAYLNRAYINAGIKTVLWGCSIEPEIARSPTVSDDLKKYSFIVARESITYNVLKEIGANCRLAPDPAFYMNEKESKLSQWMCTKEVIGINISPLICKVGRQCNLILRAYEKVIEYILCSTSYDIALIPHVVWRTNDDRTVLEELRSRFPNYNNRFIVVDDSPADILKGIISKCHIFIGARTHSTIAAYSSCVPTIVVGYSVKAKGIAEDLFGSIDKYVVSAQSMKSDQDILNSFIWMEENYLEIKSHLNSLIPIYKARGREEYNLIIQEIMRTKING